MKRNFIFLMMISCTVAISAQRIDFNNFGRSEAEGLAPGYVAWTFGRVTSATGTFLSADSDSIHITISAIPGLNGNGIRTGYWKLGVIQLGSKLLGDACSVVNLDEEHNYTEITNGSSGLQLKIKGLKPGKHTIMAYHNAVDGYDNHSTPPLDVIVNGEVCVTNAPQTIRATKTAESGQSYAFFSVKDSDTITVQFISKPVDGKTYAWTGVALNAIVFDETNPLTCASNPTPKDYDMHIDADDGKFLLGWTPATIAVKHHIMLGTTSGVLSEVAAITDSTYLLSNLINKYNYYWRIDEETADGTLYKGEEWHFRPRHLAFPTAEGYGRFAQGGRGGKVVFVTNLNDMGEGSFRNAVTCGIGPRTVVFNVSGRIKSQSRIVMDEDVTVAGQTAPGKGICISGAPVGVSHDGICRFIRVRLGHGETYDGMGMAGVNYGIVDHCSIGWTIDEAFSSRNAKNITLQHTLISEALSIAGHKNYPFGADHGFSGSISGDVGSFHHNLLANNSGRNWSLAGGLDGDGNLQGRLDIFNNIIYNWCRHACYNGAHEVNFVNNYYKRGPATYQTNGIKIILSADPPTSKTSSQRYYFSGNIEPGVFDEGDQKMAHTPNGKEEAVYDTMYYKQWVDQPFFPSYAKIETAREAYKSVLSDVGCNSPLFDDHDKRMIEETNKGIWHFKGSVSGHFGLIDSEEDCGGYEDYPEMTREAGYDVDNDGMPNWWESLKGTNANSADNNDDANGDGYTNLEDYLNWMADQHVLLEVGKKAEVNLSELFRGYADSPKYSYQCDGANLKLSLASDSLLTISAANSYPGLQSITLTVVDTAGSTMSRIFNVAVLGSATGIRTLENIQDSKNAPYYNLQGIIVNHPSKGIYIRNGRKMIRH